ncbi:MAG: prepilin-type N-terminal cleavage/methylation domain-containing protein [Nitrospira sp.]|nr:prepilin-type N-terminal cleavage/methylation domain-containing protein [bacterium]MBL7048320.1 prepilin-type N-terminal cleavage/methylation domain-containing protein [Nitrospira sp.]
MVHSITKNINQSGFTLLELVVVVAILAVIAGAIIWSPASRIGDTAKIEAARFEMEQIRQTLLRFRQDNQIFPVQNSAADISFLFEQGTLVSWRVDYKTGWRGPYLSGGDSGRVDIGDNLKLDGSGLPYVIDTTAVTLQRAIPDPFAYAPVNNGEIRPNLDTPCSEVAANSACLFDWRLVGQASTDQPISRYGRPYLFFDLNNTSLARIVSMGEDGIYQSGVITACSNKYTVTGTNDDLVLCIF